MVRKLVNTTTIRFHYPAANPWRGLFLRMARKRLSAGFGGYGFSGTWDSYQQMHIPAALAFVAICAEFSAA